MTETYSRMVERCDGLIYSYKATCVSILIHAWMIFVLGYAAVHI